MVCSTCCRLDMSQITQHTRSKITYRFLPFALLTMIVFALPCVREHYHNTFELIHRYFRLIAIGLFLYSHIVICEVYKSSICVFVLLILIFLLTVYPLLIKHKIS
eukprot:998833_1